MSTVDVGSKYEKVAANFFIDAGYEILKSNYRFKHLEIDLVVMKENVIVFVEVKYRKVVPGYNAFLSVGKQKQKNIITCAHVYWETSVHNKSCFSRFDVLIIEEKEGEIKYNHIKQAFQQ